MFIATKAQHNVEAAGRQDRPVPGLGFMVRRTPHPVIVAIRDNKDYIRSSHIPIIPLLRGGGSS